MKDIKAEKLIFSLISKIIGFFKGVVGLNILARDFEEIKGQKL
jgi:hypothetical protein